MSSSTVPTVLAALYTAISNASFPSTTQKAYGRPRKGQQQRRCVIVGDVTTDDQQWATLGGREREENYTVEVFVEVDLASSDTKTATEDAYAAWAVVESALRTTPALGVTGVRYFEAEIGPATHTRFETDSGEFIQIPGAVRCRARI